MSSNKKILLFHHCDGWGGGGISLITVIRMLKSNYDIVVCLPHSGTLLSEKVQAERVKVIFLDDNIGLIDSFSGGPPTFSRAFMICFAKIFVHTGWKYWKIIKEQDPELIAVNSMTLAWVGILAKWKGLKSVCFVRESYVKEAGIKLIQYALNHWFDGISFISQYDKECFQSRAPHQVIVEDTILPGEFSSEYVREETLRRFKLKDQFHVLFLGGTKDELKGWSVIREAMCQIDGRDIILLVAGQQDCQTSIAKDNIVYLGLCQSVEELYSFCDVVVFPALSAHQARPVFEAGYMSKPIIISDFPNTREFVVDGYNGLTFEPGNARELAEKIKILYENPEQKISLGKNNYKMSIKKHGYDSCKEKLLALMEQIFETGK